MEFPKIVGYVLLVIGLVIVIIPPIFGISILFGGSSAIPKILQTPVLSNSVSISNTSISTPDLQQIINAIFPAVNLVLLFVLSLILIYAGGVIMGKGVSLIKEIKLRAVKDTVKEEGGDIEVKKENAITPDVATPEKP